MALSLLEIIAAKKQKEKQKEEVSDDSDDSDLFSLTSIEEEVVKTDRSLYTTQYNYPIPDYQLFLNLHVPYLRNPYSLVDIRDFREYRKWLLAPSLYVIGTYKPLDAEYFLSLYMKHNPPRCVKDLPRLALWLWELGLTVPSEYERDMVEIIQEKKLDFSDFS